MILHGILSRLLLLSAFLSITAGSAIINMLKSGEIGKYLTLNLQMNTCMSILRNKLIYQPTWIEQQIKFLDSDINELTFIAEFLRQCSWIVDKSEYIFIRDINIDGKRISFPVEFNVENYHDIGYSVESEGD